MYAGHLLVAIPSLSSFKMNETKIIQIISAISFVKKQNKCKQQCIFVYKTNFKHLHFFHLIIPILGMLY